MPWPKKKNCPENKNISLQRTHCIENKKAPAAIGRAKETKTMHFGSTNVFDQNKRKAFGVGARILYQTNKISKTKKTLAATGQGSIKRSQVGRQAEPGRTSFSIMATEVMEN